MRARKSASVALVLIVAFIVCLPVLEFIDYDDIILTGQDLEISILDLLTIFCVWFILIVRLFAFLPVSWANIRTPIKALLDSRWVFCREPLGVLLLPDELCVSCDPFPLLI